MMKSETIARRRALERATARDVRIVRLQELVERDGPGSIWSELLDIEHNIEREAA